MWRSLLSVLPIILSDLCWLPGRGILIFLGLDPILGIPCSIPLQPLRDWLHYKNMYLLNQVFVQDNEHLPDWLTSSELGLSRDLAT